MKSKSLFALFVLFFVAFSSVNSKVCKTQEGVAWCEGVTCHYRSGQKFQADYCKSASSDGSLKFNGSNCRNCPIQSCDLVTPDFTGKLAVYHNANGYFLTEKGWCYYG